jgi:hypothetical protein
MLPAIAPAPANASAHEKTRLGVQPGGFLICLLRPARPTAQDNITSA